MALGSSRFVGWVNKAGKVGESLRVLGRRLAGRVGRKYSWAEAGDWQHEDNESLKHYGDGGIWMELARSD